MIDPRVEVSVITPVWEGSSRDGMAVVDLAGSVADTVRRPHELIIVENGAPGPPALRDVRRVTLPQNAGVPVGWNEGAAVARGEYLVFANDDVVVGPGCIDAMIDLLERDPEVGVVGPEGSRWDAQDGRHRSFVEGEGRQPCDVVSGFLFATRRACWERVGGFDPAYSPCSFEEVDYCHAVRASGWSCEVLSPLDYEHDWGISRSRPYRRIRFGGKSESIRSINRRNRARFRSKWGQA